MKINVKTLSKQIVARIVDEACGGKKKIKEEAERDWFDEFLDHRFSPVVLFGKSFKTSYVYKTLMPKEYQQEKAEWQKEQGVVSEQSAVVSVEGTPSVNNIIDVKGVVRRDEKELRKEKK